MNPFPGSGPRTDRAPSPWELVISRLIRFAVRCARTPTVAVAVGVLAIFPPTLLGLSGEVVVSGQDPADWNTPNVLTLMERVRELRLRGPGPSELPSYRARADAFVYFFIDRDDGSRSLVKADQLALDVLWKGPGETHQRIVGRRDKRLLPTDIHYHLDHLLVVQDEYPDRIRIGDGHEVADVLHPAAAGSHAVYDFRHAGSIDISFATGRDPVRVAEIQVRPKDLDRPGFVGSIFVDQSSGALVRLRFTFTPASYVDPYVDYIRISLDNGLWLDRHWLPRHQEFELRREVPHIDILSGSVIRTAFDIGNYDFEDTFTVPRLPRGVSAVSPQAQREFDFKEDLLSELDREGLSEPPSLSEVRTSVQEIVQDRYMSGLSRYRLRIPSASDLYRFNRTEGHALGLGLSIGASESVTVGAGGGYTFGRKRPTAELTIEGAPRPSTETSGESDAGTRWEIDFYLNHARDIGPFPGAAGVVNTLGGHLFDEDWSDPLFVSGGRAVLTLPGAAIAGGKLVLGVGLENQRAAEATIDDADQFRAVRSIQESDFLGVNAAQSWGGGAEPGDGWGGHLSVSQSIDVGATDHHYTRVLAAAGWAQTTSWENVGVAARVDAGWTQADAPRQGRFLLGGRGTLLGHDFREFEGTSFVLAGGELSRLLRPRLASARLFGAFGATFAGDPHPFVEGDLETDFSNSDLKGSIGAGIALFWDVLQIDWAYGLGGGGSGAWAFSVAERFHGWL